jgi:hypothetical protein
MSQSDQGQPASPRSCLASASLFLRIDILSSSEGMRSYTDQSPSTVSGGTYLTIYGRTVIISSWALGLWDHHAYHRVDRLLPEPLAQRRPSVDRARPALLMMRCGCGMRRARSPGLYDLAAFSFPSPVHNRALLSPRSDKVGIRVIGPAGWSTRHAGIYLNVCQLCPHAFVTHFC